MFEVRFKVEMEMMTGTTISDKEQATEACKRMLEEAVRDKTLQQLFEIQSVSVITVVAEPL